MQNTTLDNTQNSTLWSLYKTEIIITVSVLLVYLLYYLKFKTPHYLIGPSSVHKKKNIGRPLPPYANGWYCILKSSQLQKGEVKNIDISGQNLVAYRGTDGLVYVLQAYCLHIGANLGVGGQVINQKLIQCPFHGWLYDGKTGHCVDHDGKVLQLQSIQYNQDLCQKDGKINWKTTPKQKIKLRKYPVQQINKYIFIWLHALPQYQQKPLYPMVNLSNFIKDLEYRGRAEHHVMCHMQDIPQNGADSLHFKYVHTYFNPNQIIKSIFFRWDNLWMKGDDKDLPSMFQHKNKKIRAFKQRVYKQIIEPFPNREMLSIGNLESYMTFPILGQCFILSATIIQVGLAVVYIVIKTPFYQLILSHYIRPNGKAFQKVYHDVHISSYVPYWLSSLIGYLQAGQVTNDLYVWQAKRFSRKTYLHDDRQSDTYIKNWRTWASQHYQGCSKQQNGSINW